MKDQFATCRWQVAATSSKTGGYLKLPKGQMQTNPSFSAIRENQILWNLVLFCCNGYEQINTTQR